MIEELGNAADVPSTGIPILLGVVFKSTGGQPLTQAPMKEGPYSENDFRRSAAFYGIPYHAPSVFPIGANPSRAVLWMQKNHPAHAKVRARALPGVFVVIATSASSTSWVISRLGSATAPTR